MDGEPRGRKVGEEAIDAGMREAFRKGGTGRSVLARLKARGGPVPRVLLVGTGPDSGPIVRAGTREGGAGGHRYQVAGEIARGGVGVVLKGRDVDLGRDVAVKILLEKHESNAEVVQRFVEEAQIGGQLQHPGIVPVHELGMTTDGRPFIAMKLVKGRTLTALLLERESPSEDRPRFLGIFEKVCQTLAYAHSRGVVHRDLKPSNVLVGSFGEVQVLDWGLAKVLARGGVEDERRATRSRIDASVIETVRSGRPDSDSLAGSVMGTPEYMAPEQADGRVEDIDERTDVFALGAMLCEILAGEPPYRGKEAHPVVEAREACQADALARLDACGADPELVGLAKRCLLRRREARPRDAGEVARAVAEHLARVEERARDAEVAAAEAVVKVRARAEAFLAAVRGEATRAREAAAAARRDRETADALRSISLLRGDDFDARTVDAEFREAFAAYGIDTASPNLRATAERIGGSAVAADLVAALDGWIGVRRDAGDGAGAERLLAVVRFVDPDPVRDRIRTLAAAGESSKLVELAKEPEKLPLPTLLVLGDSLGRAGGVPEAIVVLAAARHRAPADFRAAFRLGFWKSRAEPPDHAGAEALFSLLVALRPGEAGALYHLGQALHGQGDAPGAIGRWIDALTADPERFGFLRDRIADAAVALAKSQRRSAVVPLSELERVAALHPDRDDVQRELGLALARAGSWEAARDALARALWTEERDALVPMAYAVALLRTGDEAGAIRVLRESARRNPDGLRSGAVQLGTVGRRFVHRPPALDAPGPDDDPERRRLMGIGRGYFDFRATDAALVVYGEILREDPGSAAAEFGRAIALFYLERKEDAAKAFRRAAGLDPEDAGPLYWLGSLEAAAGNPAEALRIWDEAFLRDPSHRRLRQTLTGVIVMNPGPSPADVRLLATNLAMLEAEPARRVGVLEQAVRRAPDNLPIARDLATNLRLCGRDREAAKAFVRALETAERTEKPRGWIAAHYATLLAESGDPEVRDPAAALEVAKAGVEAQDTPYGRVALGIALYRLERYEEAVSALEGARSDTISCSLYLAMARLRAGDRKGAERALDVALKYISVYSKLLPFSGRVIALRAEACGLLGRPVPDHR